MTPNSLNIDIHMGMEREIEIENVEEMGIEKK